MKCDVNIRKNLHANVVLSSGTNKFQGMVECITNDLTARAPSTMRSRWLLHLTETSSLLALNVPSFDDKEACRIYDTSFQSNIECDVYTCKESCDNIVFTTMFQWIA